MHRAGVACGCRPAAVELAQDRQDAAGAVHVLDVTSGADGRDLAQMRHAARQPVDVAHREVDARASCAAARRCSTVLVEPPMAMSSVIAFSNASKLGDGARQHRRVVLLVVAARQVDDETAGFDEQSLAVGVGGERCVPLPGSARPSASVRQFIELAVNMPEHEPQVGQAERSITATSASLTVSSAAAIMASIRSTACVLPPSA